MTQIQTQSQEEWLHHHLKENCVTHRHNSQQRPAKLRGNSLTVSVKVPQSLKEALKEVAKGRSYFRSINACVRDVLFSRYHFPDIPEPDPHDARVRLSLRLTCAEWNALRSYAKAWKLPLWRAIWFLAAKPYTVDDRPAKALHRPTKAPRGHYSTEEIKKKDIKKNDLNVCTQTAQLKPVSSLADELWSKFGISLPVANDLVSNYETEAIQAAIEITATRNGSIYNPAGFIIHLLKGGVAQRYADAKRLSQDSETAAQKVKKAVEEAGFEVVLVDDQPAIPCPNGWLILPPNVERALELARRFAQPCRKPNSEPVSEFGERIEPPNLMDSELMDSEDNDAPDEPSELSEFAFKLYPFAAPDSMLKAPKPRSRAEKAAEIIAEQQFGVTQRPKRFCPRCLRESVDLQLKKFEVRFPQVVDAELERWNGKEVCFGDPSSCWESLTRSELCAFKDLVLKYSDTEQTHPKLCEQKPMHAHANLPSPQSEKSNSPSPSVICPKCGRSVSQRRIGQSGICLDCVEQDLKTHRQSQTNQV